MMEFKESHIAVFPLNLFLLPGDYTQLYIFEDRYKQLIGDCLDSQKDFGIAFSNKLNEHNLGTLVEVTEIIKKYPSGEMDIMVRAKSVFQLEEFYFQKEGKLYPEGKVKQFPAIQNYQATAALVLRFRDNLIANDQYNSELLNKSQIGLFDIANEMYLSDQEKMELVSLQDQSKMERYLHNYIRYLELLQAQEKGLFQGIYLN